MHFFQLHPTVSSCRFPFIACEIFTCEVDIILRALVEDEEVSVLILLYVVKHYLLAILL